VNSNRIWQIGTAIVIVVVVALGWVLGISPKVAEIAKSDADTRAVEAQNAIHQQELAALKKLAANKDSLLAELVPLEASIPGGLDIQNLLIQLNSMASANSTSIQNIATDSPFLYAPEDDASVVPTATADPNNFVLVPITIRVTGGYQALLNFTDGLQNGQRLILVNGIVIASKSGKSSVDENGVEVPGSKTFEAEIEGFIFVLVDPNAPPPDPNATPLPVPSETPTPSPTESATPGATPTPTESATATP
jgi:Tfp pilus assembly protein PilO